MKKFISYHIYFLLLLFIAAGILSLPSCDDDKQDAPSIKYVRNYAASPNDTILKAVKVDQWVVVVGTNLSGVSQAYFGTTPATINSTFFSDTCIVIQIPSVNYENVARDKVNEIILVNAGGTATFKIPIDGVPIISRIRAVAAAPNDTILHSVVPRQEINIVGYNLKNATKITFQGVVADLSNAVFTDTSVVVKVPTELGGGDATQANIIGVTNYVGKGTFFMKIIGPPIITRISYEIPKEGDSVYVYGNNFISVKAFSFAGTVITDYKVISDERIGFKAPANLSTDGGVVSVETRSGTYTTAYKVNNVNFINGGGVGILGNMEWGDYFGWPWWGGNTTLTSSDPNSGWPSYNADFGVGLGMYMQYKSDKLAPGAGNDGNALRMNEAKKGWVPTENINDAGGSWALKFEINVKKPWKGGTLCIKTTKGSFMARYEPWQVSASKSVAFTTKGWQTVTIPLSDFRAKDAELGDGKGKSIEKVVDLLDPAKNNSDLVIYLHNYGSAEMETAFDAAFDNFRIVKR